MTSLDAGVKYKGLSLEGEYYWRWLSNFTGVNTSGIANINDHGYQLQTSAMAVPKALQLYFGASQMFGQLRRPVGSARRRELVPDEGARDSPQRRVDVREPITRGIHGLSLPGRRQGPGVPHQPRDELLIDEVNDDSQTLVPFGGSSQRLLRAGAAGAVLRPRASARRTGSGCRQRVQRLALPPDELHPAGHRAPASSSRSWATGSAARRCSASRSSSSGRTRTPAISRRPTTCRATRRSTTTRSPTPTSRASTGR